LTPFERAALQDAEHWIISRPLRKPARPRHVPMTFSLIALNLAAFAALEMSGGSQDIMTAVRFGAMWPPLLVEQGEWWRLLSALFLHFGPLHLSINMLLLFLLGRDCESRSGSVRFLVVYLMGGVSSSAAVLALMWYRWTAPAVLIGASGAIFALIGFEVANRLLAWLSRRDAVDSRGLIIIAIVLVVQFGIDLSLPQVSLGAHASGFVAGMVLGSLMHRLRPQQA
jgi:rhomboid protease GluP